MKISVHVSSGKSLRLRDSTDSAVGITAQDTQRFTQKKKRKAGERKFCLDFFSNLFHVNCIFIFIFIFYFLFYFNIFFKLPSTLDTWPSTLDILPSTLDSRQLVTLPERFVYNTWWLYAIPWNPVNPITKGHNNLAVLAE